MTRRLSFCLLFLAIVGQAHADHFDFAITGPTGTTHGLPTVSWEAIAGSPAIQVTITTDAGGNDIFWQSFVAGYPGDQYQFGPIPQGNYYSFVNAFDGGNQHPANNNGVPFEVNQGAPIPGIHPPGLEPGIGAP